MLYFVATPIGNLEEITLRALEVLKSAEVIAAEDTRHTAILLKKYDISTRTIAYHKFNEKSVVREIIAMLKDGKNVAVVSDAGMPAVSDPGHILISAAIENGVDFTVVSGACAAINALLLSGFDTRSFAVLGFLPEKNIDRARYIEPFVALPAPLVVYSAVHDIQKDLAFLYESLGPRNVAVCREMTKMYETVTRCRLGEAMEITERGEFVIVAEGYRGDDFAGMSIEQHISKYVAIGLSVAESVKKVAADRRLPKSVVYKASLQMKDDGML